MNFWIYAIIAFGLLTLLLILILSLPTIMEPMVRIKKIKCPRCRQHFDPIAEIISDAQSHCTIPRCGLELVNLVKLKRRLEKPKNDYVFRKRKFYEIETGIVNNNNDIEVLNWEEPLQIHVVDSTNKYVE